MVEKHGESLPAQRPTVDFVGLTCPDRFLFGCGMDIHGYGRNLPALYALKI
jgi:hypoxanthine phosphoribosyltransferase